MHCFEDMALNNGLTLATYRFRRADSVCAFIDRGIVASSYGRAKVRIKCWSQCHIFRRQGIFSGSLRQILDFEIKDFASEAFSAGASAKNTFAEYEK